MHIANLKNVTHPCGYLPSLIATDETFITLEMSSAERDILLARGYRAFGKYNFCPNCVKCHRCVPLRVPLDQFRPSKSQRRVANRCAQVGVSIAPALYSREKYEVFKDHSRRFNAAPMLEEDIVFSFYEPSVPALEFSYRLENRLIGVGIVHETPQALSSVYFAYLLDFAHLSLGTFSVMKEIEHGIRLKKKMLYLGYYIRDNHFMSYKASFLPNEILTSQGKWVPFRKEHGKNRSDDPRFVPKSIIRC